MVDFGQVTRDDVRQAMAEYDDSGPGGPGDARVYTLTYAGRQYDALTLAAVAYQWATGDPVTDAEVEADAVEAANHLQALAFELAGPDLRPLRFATATTVGQEHARATWALAARERLSEAAATYRAVVTVPELADYVQRRSLIRTNQQPRAWLGDVLARVAEECSRRGEPLLPSLCVDAAGHVGRGYATALEMLRGEVVSDPDDHAAHERLACHRRFGAVLPADGGEPVRIESPAPRRTSRAASPARSSRTPTARPAGRAAPRATAKAEEKPVVTCPVHFTVLPANGICDLCE